MRQKTILGLVAVMAASTLLPTAGMAQQSASERQATRPETMSVQVTNNNWQDMHIYASVSGSPIRSLGMVTAMGSDEFRLPPDLAAVGNDLRVIADPVGGNGLYESQTLLVNPGSKVVMTLQNPLDLSYTTVAPKSPDA